MKDIPKMEKYRLGYILNDYSEEEKKLINNVKARFQNDFKETKS